MRGRGGKPISGSSECMRLIARTMLDLENRDQPSRPPVVNQILADWENSNPGSNLFARATYIRRFGNQGELIRDGVN